MMFALLTLNTFAKEGIILYMRLQPGNHRNFCRS